MHAAGAGDAGGPGVDPGRAGTVDELWSPRRRANGTKLLGHRGRPADLRVGDLRRRRIGVAGAGVPVRRRGARPHAARPDRPWLADRRVTARRRARAREVGVSESGGVPAVLAVGRCIEVWADPAAACPSWSAVRRFDAVRESWLAQAGVERLEEQQGSPERTALVDGEHVLARAIEAGS